MDELAPILKLVAQGGGGAIALVFATLWWLERRERMQLYKQNLDLSESMRQMNEAWLRVLDGRSR